jgi:hypothetical protein
MNSTDDKNRIKLWANASSFLEIKPGQENLIRVIEANYIAISIPLDYRMMQDDTRVKISAQAVHENGSNQLHSILGF